jgi:hypothetical protein
VVTRLPFPPVRVSVAVTARRRDYKATLGRRPARPPRQLRPPHRFPVRPPVMSHPDLEAGPPRPRGGGPAATPPPADRATDVSAPPSVILQFRFAMVRFPLVFSETLNQTVVRASSGLVMVWASRQRGFISVPRFQVSDHWCIFCVFLLFGDCARGNLNLLVLLSVLYLHALQ